MKVALVHDWLTGMRGGEKVLREIGRMYPQADLFAVLHTPGRCDRLIEDRRIVSSWLNRLPAVERYYRYLLPVMPWAIESLDLRGYELILSSSHCVAHGVRRPRGAVHVCYCHSPMRYAWSQGQAYRQALGGLALALFRDPLRRWDRRAAQDVDLFVANSHNVARRIRQAYARKAWVVYPPVDTDFYTPAPIRREDFYLVVGTLAPYKRIDQAVRAFGRLTDRRLVVIGSGQMAAALRRMAPGNVTLLGWQSDQVVRDHYRRCRALLFPGEEDFGIVPVEAAACGCPVIAYRAGGALETVIGVKDGQGPATGLYYSPQTVDALVAAIREFEDLPDCWEAGQMARHAARFGPVRFREEFGRAVEWACREHRC